MAEVMTSDFGSAKKKRKKLIRVDMTPMVDLGFLLITFFMFTTNFSKPNILDLGLPAKGPVDGKVIDQKNQITFILGKDNRIFWHQSNSNELNSANFNESTLDGLALSKLISEKHKTAPDPNKFTIIIKATDEANYKNFVDILDNLALTKSERYGITDIKPWEEKIYDEKVK